MFPFCANDEHVYSMLNIHFHEEKSFVLPKLYLAELYIDHAHQLTTKGSIDIPIKLTLLFRSACIKL